MGVVVWRVVWGWYGCGEMGLILLGCCYGCGGMGVVWVVVWRWWYWEGGMEVLVWVWRYGWYYGCGGMDIVVWMLV